MTEAWFSPETARLFSYLSLLSLYSVFAVPAKRLEHVGSVSNDLSARIFLQAL